MTLQPRDWTIIPEQTAQIARAAFAKGNIYMKMRDELGVIYSESDFVTLFRADCGQPPISPAQLALVSVMQFAEGLTDRQTADAVRARLDWKYALGLELTDPGFDFSVLSEFRSRLIKSGRESQLLEQMLKCFKQKGLIKARGKARTDSTHVLAAIHQLNRIECVAETLRHVLNELATVAPEWLSKQVSRDWFDRYSSRLEQSRLPPTKQEQQQLAITIGCDGHQLLSAIYDGKAPQPLQQLPCVEILRQVWVQQYYLDTGVVQWRTTDNLPPNKQLIFSPYDPEARNRTKRQMNWTGYTVHLTETCDSDKPHLITHVETTPATTGDVEMTAVIHQALADKDLLPGEHLVDTAYVDAEHLLCSRDEYDLDLVGPVPSDTSWQAQTGQGFDLSCFQVDWEAKRVICPMGSQSHSWRLHCDNYDNPVVRVRFRSSDCRACSSRSQCTRSPKLSRVLTLRPMAQHLALTAARERQTTTEFKQRYAKRAGVEGTISQAVGAFGLRHCRYIGLAKTHLQHIATAAAINFSRLFDWLRAVPRSQTRQSRFAALKPLPQDNLSSQALHCGA
jgi:transposase